MGLTNFSGFSSEFCAERAERVKLVLGMGLYLAQTTLNGSQSIQNQEAPLHYIIQRIDQNKENDAYVFV